MVTVQWYGIDSTVVMQSACQWRHNIITFIAYHHILMYPRPLQTLLKQSHSTQPRSARQVRDEN